MPGENIQDWSVTAANNANSDTSINWAEGQPRASVNNSSRSMMAAHAKDRNLHNGSITTGGSANAQTFFSGLNYTAPIPTGLRVLLNIGPALTNTGAATLEMDGLGAVAIKDLLAADLVAGAMTTGAYAEFIYNGTNWILLATLSALTAPTAPVGDRDTSIANTAWVGAEVPSILAARSAFSVHNTVAQTGFPVSLPTLIGFDVADVNLGSNYNVPSAVWTPPAGRISLSVGLWTESLGGFQSIAIFAFYKNGALLKGVNHVYASAFGGVSFTAVDIATGTDAYNCLALFQAGGTVHTGSYFCGILM